MRFINHFRPLASTLNIPNEDGSDCNEIYRNYERLSASSCNFVAVRLGKENALRRSPYVNTIDARPFRSAYLVFNFSFGK